MIERTTQRVFSKVLGLSCGLLFLAGAVIAQLQSGNLYGTTKDDKGTVLPGVSVTLSGQGAPQTQSTDATGQFHFLGLSPGAYAVKAELQGFATVDYPSVVINVGRNTTIEVALAGAVEDVITVTSESPLLDEKSLRPGNTVSQVELSKIPTARDPWAILQSTPGVLTDRINVGGNESGQQSNYVGPGSAGTEAVWSMDGVVITDMAATGSSPGYYDFDSFEELQVTTGGSDASIATGGVVLNMVTKRGTNTWRGSGRYNQADKGQQAGTGFDNGDLAKAGAWNTTKTTIVPPAAGGPHAQPTFKAGNRIQNVNDYGAEVGGPVVKDKFWVWGSYSKNQIDLKTVDDFSDKTSLKDWNGKLNWQIVPSNSLTGFVWNSDKTKIGRNAGPLRPQPTTWDQSVFGGTPTTYKIEDTHIASSSLYLTGMYSKVNGGFELRPEGGAKNAYLDENGIWRNTQELIQTARPQTQARIDASSFFNTGSLSNELKYGLGYRTAEVTSLSSWSGGSFEENANNLGGVPEASLIFITRDGKPDLRTDYKSAYLQDTISAGNLTANIGVRYDVQGGKNLASSVSASLLRPDLLPAQSYAGGGIGFEWKNITPRLGLTYALGQEHKTLLRASYSRFADQLGQGTALVLNPITAYSYSYFYGYAQGGGTLPGSAYAGPPAGFSGNANPFTGALLLSNGVDRHLAAPLTDEVLLSIEHALLPEFVVGLNLTYRKHTGIIDAQALVFDDGAFASQNMNNIGRLNRPEDYVVHQSTTRTVRINGVNTIVPRLLPNGQPYTLTYYDLKPGVTTRNGVFLQNGDREQTYKGASLTFNKRLSNRWSMRGNVSYQDWKWRVPSSFLIDPTVFLGSGFRNGEQVLQGSGTGSGSKGQVYINSKYSYSLNALYQVAPDRPWGFNVAGNVTGRQGYPQQYYERFARAGFNNAAVSVQVTNSGTSFRNPNLNVLDLRIEKEFSFSDFGFTLGIDAFNVTNDSVVLQRNGRLARANSDFVQEIVSPRIFRLGAKFSLH